MGPNSNITQAERIAALEVRVSDMQRSQQEINNKLDELLALRNKGIGAFWLSSGLLGTGIVGFIVQLVEWIRHG
jgi:hypothetical protein